MTKKYDESSIERFAGLAGIRKTPGTYIGPSDSSGLWTIWRELGDNHVDQCLAGRNNVSHLVEDSKSGVYWAFDHGPGIPVGEKVFENEHGAKEKLSVLYVATGLTHAGSHFSGNEISRGVHGLGQKTTNAMSKSFQVWTHRDGEWWTIEYKDAKLVGKVQKTKVPKLPHGLKTKPGTVIRFEPDLSLFMKNSSMPLEELKSWCRLTSYLVPKLEVSFTNKSGKTVTLKTRGVSEYIEKRVEKLGATTIGKPMIFTSPEVDVAVAFSDLEGDNVDAYTNGLRNKEGGEHLRAMQAALVKSLRELSKPDKKGKYKWTPQDVCDGLLGLVNFKISAPKFNNQPKDKLIDERVFDVAYAQFLKAWQDFWSKNKSLAKDIVTRAETLREKTADFLKDKKLVKNVNAAKKAIGTKLATIQGNAPVEERELFLVEGDSAGGGIKRVRDRKFQAVYPMKGKPLNPIDTKKEKINSNTEIVEMLAALGVRLDGKEAGKIEYGKVIQLADADVDGGHINVLVLAVLWTYTPHLIRNGHVYAVKSPLYKGKYKDKVVFGMTKEEIYKKVGSDKVDITYLKGWGELNDEDLEVAIKPGVRELIRITPPSKEQAKEFHAMLGNDTSYRRKMIGLGKDE